MVAMMPPIKTRQDWDRVLGRSELENLCVKLITRDVSEVNQCLWFNIWLSSPCRRGGWSWWQRRQTEPISACCRNSSQSNSGGENKGGGGCLGIFSSCIWTMKCWWGCIFITIGTVCIHMCTSMLWVFVHYQQALVMSAYHVPQGRLLSLRFLRFVRASLVSPVCLRLLNPSFLIRFFPSTVQEKTKARSNNFGCNLSLCKIHDLTFF